MKQTEYIQPIVLIEEIELAESFAQTTPANISGLNDPTKPGTYDPDM